MMEPTREGLDEPRALTDREVAGLIPTLEEMEVHAEARRYQKLEAYGEASVDHIAARWSHLKVTLLLSGVKAGRGRRAGPPEQIWQATHRPPPDAECIAAHLRGMDLLVDLEGEDARAWSRASQEVEAAMRRIAPPPMTPRLPPGGQLPTPSGTSR